MDFDNQADKAWLLGVQRKLYRWSKETPVGAYGDVWNWVTDPRNLRCAWYSIAQNKGRRTPGVDGLTVVGIATGDGGVPLFLEELWKALRNGSYRPSPARRKWIPKPGKPGKFRPLGIPTVADRVVQCAVKNILEPIFEARFWQVSYGFRPGRGCHGALEHIRLVIRPRKSRANGQMRDPPYQWAIEGDIEGCFDNIGHHHLMERVRKSVADRKVNRLIVRFLKSGVLEDFKYNPTATGTPQGGVLSPLLANITLSAIEERYWKWTRHPHDPKYRSDGARRAIKQRYRDREAGRPVFYPVRYADDFLIFVAGGYDDAAAEKQALADWLREEMGLTLSEEKTRITRLTEGFRFLGCRVRLKWDDRYGYRCRIEIPKEAVNDFRWRIKKVLNQRTRLRSLESILREINPKAYPSGSGRINGWWPRCYARSGATRLRPRQSALSRPTTRSPTDNCVAPSYCVTGCRGISLLIQSSGDGATTTAIAPGPSAYCTFWTGMCGDGSGCGCGVNTTALPAGRCTLLGVGPAGSVPACGSGPRVALSNTRCAGSRSCGLRSIG